MPLNKPWLLQYLSLFFLFFSELITTNFCANSVHMLFIQCGYGIGSLFINTIAGWRYMFGVSIPLAVIMGIGMYMLPESPRWLLLCVMKGKGNFQDLKQSAIRNLCCLRGQRVGYSAPALVDEMLNELSFVGEEEEASLAELFRGKGLRALTIGAGIVLFQQVAQ